MTAQEGQSCKASNPDSAPLADASEQFICRVFSTQEITAIKQVPGMMKVLIVLFAAIVVLIFIPFQTVTTLATSVGELTSGMSALTTRTAEQNRRIIDRHKDISELKKQYDEMQKKLYWINRNSREANERVKELRALLLSEALTATRKGRADFPSASEEAFPGVE